MSEFHNHPSVAEGEAESESGALVRPLIHSFLESDDDSDWEDIASASKPTSTTQRDGVLDATWHLTTETRGLGQSHMVQSFVTISDDGVAVSNSPPEDDSCLLKPLTEVNGEELFDQTGYDDDDDNRELYPACESELEDECNSEEINGVFDQEDEQDNSSAQSPVVHESYVDGQIDNDNFKLTDEDGEQKKPPSECDIPSIVTEDVTESGDMPARTAEKEIIPPQGQSCILYPQCNEEESLLNMVEGARVVLAIVAFGIFAAYIGVGLLKCNQIEAVHDGTSFDVPATFLRGFAREAALCEKSCCFSLFILTGDEYAHEAAVIRAMSEVPRFKTVNMKPVVWSTKALLAWTTGYIDDQTENGAVVLVPYAETLDTSEVQRIIRYGQRACRLGSKTAASSKIVVLSTSFGATSLSDPDEVLTDRLNLEIKRRDWFVVPEIVLNYHGIVHGIRGKQPQRVFEEFLRASQSSSKDNPSPFVDAEELLTLRSPSALLDKWLESKRRTFAWTERAYQILLNKVTQIQALPLAREWLEQQYSDWTKNGTCESVLFRSSVSDVRAFTVACALTSAA